MKITRKQIRNIIREMIEDEEVLDMTDEEAEILASVAADLSAESSESDLEKELQDIRTQAKDIETGKKVGAAAKQKAVNVTVGAADKMVASKSGREKLAGMIESGGQMPEKFRNWLIDSVCGGAQTFEEIGSSDSKAMGYAKKICRVMAQGSTLITSGFGATWVMSKASPYIADFLRSLSDEEAAAIWEFAKDAAKDSTAKPGAPATGKAPAPKTENTQITKRQLRRIIRNELSIVR